MSEKRKKCRLCGAVTLPKPTCDDCQHSFSNPFDQRFCHKLVVGFLTSERKWL
jgi:transposase-like protein